MTAKKGMIQETARRVPTVLNHRNGRLQEASDVPTSIDSIALVIRIQSQKKKQVQNDAQMITTYYQWCFSNKCGACISFTLLILSITLMWSSPSQAAKSTKLKTHGIDLKQMGFFWKLEKTSWKMLELHFSHTFWTHPGVMVKCVGGNICNLKMFGWKFGIWKTMQFLFSIELMCHLLSKNCIWVYFCWTESWINQTHKKSFREKFANI